MWISIKKQPPFSHCLLFTMRIYKHPTANGVLENFAIFHFPFFEQKQTACVNNLEPLIGSYWRVDFQPRQFIILPSYALSYVDMLRPFMWQLQMAMFNLMWSSFRSSLTIVVYGSLCSRISDKKLMVKCD